jgi:hypothetical protein
VTVAASKQANVKQKWEGKEQKRWLRSRVIWRKLRWSPPCDEQSESNDMALGDLTASLVDAASIGDRRVETNVCFDLLE